VVQRAEEVILSFSRPGRIDLAPLRNGFGDRLVAAWADGGEETGRVVLQLLPGAAVHSFSLEDNHVVVIDVSGSVVPQSLTQPAPDPEQEAIQELKRALEQRDKMIADLLARVERLEREVALSSADLDRVAAGQAGAAPPIGEAPLPRAGSRPVAAVTEPSSDRGFEPLAVPSKSAIPEPAPAAVRQGRGGDGADTAAQRDEGAPAGGEPGEPQRRETAQTEAPAPGQVEVDDEAVERALDFTLVEQGALLLPAGRAEITPRFSYTRRTGDFPAVVNGQVAERDLRRNEFDFFAGLEVGLPFDSQLELGLPYNIVDQSIVDRVGGTGVREQSDTGYGLGDFSVGLAKTVLREERWWPDVILRVNWDTGTGERQNNDVVLDGGFQDLTGSLSLTKRQDPLVFVGGAFYQWAYDQTDNIDLGDQFGFSAGTFLAASPNTSLSLVLNQSFIDEFKVDGQKIDGSDRVQSILSFGAGVILARNVLLSGSVGAGLTDDSPDYSVSVALPIRFSTPGL
jgi:hypothetical protein